MTDAFIHLSAPHVGRREREALLAAFDSNWIAPAGPDLAVFEEAVGRRLGRHAVALSSGTAALHLALEVLGVGRGDVVLVPTLTFAATVNPVCYLGAEPVLVDSDGSTWALDPVLVASGIDAARRAGRRVAAVVAVDLYGQCADYDALESVCQDAGVPLVVDAAESMGARYRGRPAGSAGTVAVLSFNGNKIITTGGGGMLVSGDTSLVERARYLATQARDPVAHYEHRAVGYNYRLGNLAAALGRAQVDALEARVAARRRVRAGYECRLAGVPGLDFMPVADYGEPNHWLTVITLDPVRSGAVPEQVRLSLLAGDVEARRAWKPMHQQPVFAGLRTVGRAVADDVFARGLCLPSGSALTESDLDRVVDAVVAAVPAAGGRRVS